MRQVPFRNVLKTADASVTHLWEGREAKTGGLLIVLDPVGGRNDARKEEVASRKADRVLGLAIAGLVSRPGDSRLAILDSLALTIPNIE